MRFINKIVFLLLAAIICFPIQTYGMNSLLLILFVVMCLVKIWVGKEDFKWGKGKYFLINSAFYLFIVLTFFYSDNLKEYANNAQTGLGLAIFPLFMLHLDFGLNKKKIDTLLMLFVLANLVMVCYWGYYFFEIDFFSSRNMRRVLTRFIFRKPLLNHSYVEWHPSYTGLWLSFSILVLISKISLKRRWLFNVFCVVLAILFYGVIFLLQARTAFIATTIATLVLGMSKAQKVKHKVYVILVGIALLGGVFFSILNNKTLRNRYYKPMVETLDTDLENRSFLKRSVTMECSLELIGNSMLFGYGLGDVKDRLKSCYKSKNNGLLYEQGHNSHNNYLHFLLVGGVVLLALFLLMLAHNFKMAWVQRDFLFLTFLLLIALSCVTENILSRIHGVIFFSLFNAILYKRNLIFAENPELGEQ